MPSYPRHPAAVCLTWAALLLNLASCEPRSLNGDDVFASFPPIPRALYYQPSNEQLTNLEAPIPPQCYTRTEQQYNPCYVCHQAYDRSAAAPYRMNKLDDGGLQGTYLFSDIGVDNHWQNVFIDRTDYIAAISDDAILRYVNQDNYSPLHRRLTARNWQGYLPDLAHYAYPRRAFDDQGHARDQSRWVAFNYKPFPSTFWPTNGSTDDVAIRLPSAFSSLNGVFDRQIYQLNLALVESTIKSLGTLSVAKFNEQTYALDINGDGQLKAAETELVSRSHYVGDASEVPVLPQQYPQGTEFLHSVRYLGVDNNGDITTPPRMKELRYMKKIRALTEASLDNRYRRERKEKVDEELPHFANHRERGLENDFGWLLTGFIEDAQGHLRPQTTEETMACMGCHSAIGSTIDQTFAFARKITGAAGWGYINLKGMRDAPSVSSDTPEILEYLQRVGGGDEFRQNTEMLNRWFEHGQVKAEAVRNADVYTLITPSKQRALALNKAYTHTVRSQRYVFGRDATWQPATQVFMHVDASQAPLARAQQWLGWDLRLNWQAGQRATTVK